MALETPACRGRECTSISNVSDFGRGRSEFPNTESLILAQNERWRRGLGMQVERGWGKLQSSGERVSSAWETYPLDGDNTSNEVLIPDKTTGSHGSVVKDGLCLQAITRGWSRVPLASW